MDSDTKNAIAMFALVFVAAFVGVFIGGIGERQEMQKEAIKNNAAEWRIDPKTGEKKFVWITAEARP
jgi:hypothetical protein